ncbi:MAG: hypothetical protein IID44_22235, partial [Planctomycetes bacterium]|nr:hypothetical protein [Planctomycetota bacterium]
MAGSTVNRVVASIFVVPFSSASPTIDGVFGAGEWGSGYDVTFDRRDGGGQHNSTLYFQHDGSSLFVGVDSQFGTGFDVVWDIFVDGDHNGDLNGSLATPYIDVNSARPSPTGWSGYIHYRTLPSIGAEVNVGFGTGAASASGGSSNVFYEYKIPFADLDVSAGDSTGFYISFGFDGIADHRFELSTGQSLLTPQNWDTLNLLPQQQPIPDPDPMPGPD